MKDQDLEHAQRDGVRMSELAQLFRDTWSLHPDFACRAPGRVNLIGEHIDYHGYSVMPMALSSQDVVIAVGRKMDAVSYTHLTLPTKRIV